MSKIKKIAAGTAITAVCAAVLGMPGLTGYILEHKIQNQLATTAEKYSFSVASVEVDRQFSDSTVNIVLKGKGLRALSQESVELTGTFKHSGLFDLPALVTGDLNFNYSINSSGLKIEIPGTAKGSLSWNGLINAEMQTADIDIPLDHSNAITAHVTPISWVIATDAATTERKLSVDLSEHNWIFKDQSAVISYNVAPSNIMISDSGDAWSMTVPQATLSTLPYGSENRTVLFSLTDIGMSSEINSTDGLMNGRSTLQTGPLVMPPLANINAANIITGINMTSSFGNLDESAIASIIGFVQQLSQLDQQTLAQPTSRKAIETAMIQAFQELSRENPHLAIDEFAIKTANGDISFSFDLKSNEQLTALLGQLLEMSEPDPTSQQKMNQQMMTAFSSSASLKLTDDLIDWSCQRIGENIAKKQGASPAEGQAMSTMCKSMADSGDFLVMPCMDIANAQQQSQCTTAMEEARRVWSESKELNLALDKGQLTLNGAPITLPTSI